FRAGGESVFGSPAHHTPPFATGAEGEAGALPPSAAYRISPSHTRPRPLSRPAATSALMCLHRDPFILLSSHEHDVNHSHLYTTWVTPTRGPSRWRRDQLRSPRARGRRRRSWYR